MKRPRQFDYIKLWNYIPFIMDDNLQKRLIEAQIKEIEATVEEKKAHAALIRAQTKSEERLEVK